MHRVHVTQFSARLGPTPAVLALHVQAVGTRVFAEDEWNSFAITVAAGSQQGQVTGSSGS
jgi:hypothetical protein